MLRRASAAVLAAAAALQLLGGCVSAQEAWVITTFAGGGSGLLAANAVSMAPHSTAVDAGGNLLIADNNGHRVWLLNVTTGLVRAVAGTGADGGAVGDGGPATSARLRNPSCVALDADGNLLIADLNHHRIRRVAAGTGIITTVVGSGTLGFTGDGGPGTSASLKNPTGVAVDADGSLLIADTGNHRIRRVAAGTGIITTVAGAGAGAFGGDGGPATSASMNGPTGVAVDGDGSVLIADRSNNRIRRVAAGTGIITTVAGTGVYGFSGDGGSATSARMSFPQAVAVVAGGNLLIADTSNSRVRRVAAGTGIITTVAGKGASSPSFSGDAGPATSAGLSVPYGVTVDGGGNLLIADSNNNRVRRVAVGTGVITTAAGSGMPYGGGDGGAASSAQLYMPLAVAFDAGGNLFIADGYYFRIRRVAAGTGVITTFAGGFSGGSFGGDGGPATSAIFSTPQALAFDTGGNLLIADRDNHRIRQVAAGTGIVTTVAGNGVASFSGDGGPATSASLNWPTGVAVDGGGNVFIGDTLNHRIRRVAAGTGIITTVAGNGVNTFGGDGGPATSASLKNPSGVVLDAAGNLLIADRQNFRVRRVAAGTDIITTVAENVAANAVAVDAGGNVLIAEGGGYIRRVAAATGILTTMAGIGVSGFSGDGGLSTSANIAPMGVAVNGSGNVFLADSTSNRVRVLAATVLPTTTSSSTATATRTSTSSATGTSTASATGTSTSSATGTSTASGTATRSSSASATSSVSAAATSSTSSSSSATATRSSSASATSSPSGTATSSTSSTRTPSDSTSATASVSPTSDPINGAGAVGDVATGQPRLAGGAISGVTFAVAAVAAAFVLAVLVAYRRRRLSDSKALTDPTKNDATCGCGLFQNLQHCISNLL